MASNKILLSGDYGRIKEVTLTAVAVRPGSLLEYTSAGLLQANGTAQDPIGAKIFALEDSLQGKDKDDNYAASAVAKVVHALPGDKINAIAGAAVAVGAAVESDGNGKLITRTTGKPLAIALEAAAADNDRLVIEVL